MKISSFVLINSFKVKIIYEILFVFIRRKLVKRIPQKIAEKKSKKKIIFFFLKLILFLNKLGIYTILHQMMIVIYH